VEGAPLRVSDIFLRPFLCWSEEKATFGLRFLQSQARDTQMVIFISGIWKSLLMHAAVESHSSLDKF
jgi:hypothetical protein